MTSAEPCPTITEATVGIPTQKAGTMYLHRIIDNYPTATSPGLLTHKEHPIPTFFTDLSVAIGEEVKEALWMKQYDVAAALVEFHRRANEEPLNHTVANPLVIQREGHSIIFRIDHHSLKGA